jgi:antitoxin (DNA-binding transcriptional repressor) of toxin-antitoxin stability system
MYIRLYTVGVKVTITEFRNNLFKLVENAIAGETVEFVHQGTTVRLVIPEHSSSRLDRLTPFQVSNPDMSEKKHRIAARKLQAEMWAEMEKDWSEI